VHSVPWHHEFFCEPAYFDADAVVAGLRTPGDQGLIAQGDQSAMQPTRPVRCGRCFQRCG
jgi:hypothetical protein